MIEVELDLDVLEELASLESVRPGLLARLIDNFEHTRIAQLGELALARSIGDIERVRSLLHSLRGGAATLGMAGLARHVGTLEAAPERWMDDTQADAPLRALTTDSLRALRSWAAARQP